MVAGSEYPPTSFRILFIGLRRMMSMGDPLETAMMLSLLVMVTLCAVTDIWKHRIPNIILGPALTLAFIANSLLAGPQGFLDSALGLLFGLAVLFPLYFVGGTSAGDVKLLGVVGAFLGTKGVIIAGVSTVIFGGVFGLLFIVWRVIEPILLAHRAEAVELPMSGAITHNCSRSDEIPYAPAMACGTYFALWYLGFFG
jgi:prepilin peptidase CpaA